MDSIIHCTFIITIVEIHTLILDVCVCTVVQSYIVCRSLKIIKMVDLME